jgi:hypothetical protein
MNCREGEKEVVAKFKERPQTFLERLRKTPKTLIRIVDIQAAT